MNKTCHCCNGSGKEWDDVSIGARLKSIRTKAGISQKDMAKALSISPSMLVFLEKGLRRWTMGMIHKVEEVCKL